MTIQHVYNLYDATTETYVAQFLSSHDKLMKRECENLYEQAKQIHKQNPISPQGALYRYSDSFLMIHTADFDDQTGKYTSLDVPVTICNFSIFRTCNSNSSMCSDEQAYVSILNDSSNNNKLKSKGKIRKLTKVSPKDNLLNT